MILDFSYVNVKEPGGFLQWTWPEVLINELKSKIDTALQNGVELFCGDNKTHCRSVYLSPICWLVYLHCIGKDVVMLGYSNFIF